MTDNFAAHFRELVIPRLRREIIAQALQVGGGYATYSAAYYEVFHVACRLGALHLSDDVQADLHDFIAVQLLDEILVAERSFELLDQLVSQECAANV